LRTRTHALGTEHKLQIYKMQLERLWPFGNGNTVAASLPNENCLFF